MYRHVLKISLLAMAAITLATPAKADSLFGVPVTGPSSTTHAVPDCPSLEGQSCYNPATGDIKFFIPLGTTTSGGVFGTTLFPGGTAGTFSDSGTGTSNALTMYLSFSPVNLPVGTASLSFSFIDLDLNGGNDPAGFFESVAFYGPTGSSLTPWITTLGQSGGGTLPYTVSGDSVTQTIVFPDITSIIQDPFYVGLKFSSNSTFWGTNTPEDLTATLVTTHSSVPEPGTLLLLGSGLLAIAAVGRRSLFARV